jgi:Rad3-related DNA helicase
MMGASYYLRTASLGVKGGTVCFLTSYQGLEFLANSDLRALELESSLKFGVSVAIFSFSYFI